MKIPAVAIAAMFAGGILLGRSAFVAPHVASRPFLLTIGASVCAFLFVAVVLIRRDSLWLAATASLLSWLSQGILASCLTQQPLPPQHILSRLTAQQVPLRTPLRWSGVLRSEPVHTPWGYALDLNLQSVEMASGIVPVSGGMRIGYTPRDADPPLPQLHAGDEVSLFAEARQPLVYKDAGAFDRRDFLARQDIYLLATLRSSKLLDKPIGAQHCSPRAAKGCAPSWLHLSVSPRFWFPRASGYLRNRLETLFAEKPETSAILCAMLLGDRSFIERSESVDFQKTGTFHVLVVAGLHVGALAVFLYWLSRKLKLPRSTQAVLILVVLLSYVMVVEQRTPVLRAGLTTAIVLLGSVFYRRLDLLNSSALAALVLLVANPRYLTDSGFLLSFLAIGCIAGIAMPLVNRNIEPLLRALREWRDVTRDASHTPTMVQFRLDFRDAISVLTSPFRGRFAKLAQDFGANSVRVFLRVTELFIVSFALQFGMLALMARDFHRVSLLGPVVNLFVVPLTGVIVPLGFVGLTVGMFFNAAAKLVAHPLVWLVFLQHRIVSFFAAIPRTSYRIPGPPAWLTALFFLELVLAVIALRRQRNSLRWQPGALAALIACVSVAVAIYPFPPTVHANELEVTVLDVGQGDSIFVVSPKGSTLLIDGGGTFLGFRDNEEHLGPDPGEEAVSAYLWSRGFQKLDAVALTHAHQDHIGGLTAVLQNFHVSRLWLGRETSAPALVRLKQVANQLHVPIEREKRSQGFLWDGVQVDFLWPEDSPSDVSPIAKNNDSLVVRLHYGERTILLPGDAEKQVEYTMLAENNAAFLHADVLKVGHHGSKNSTMPEFLGAVDPRISIISAGEENPYGHPNPELLQRLEEKGTRILRTDRDGAVQILTDGHALQVSCYLACPAEPAGSLTAQAPDHSQNNQK